MQLTLCKVLILLPQIHRIVSSNYLKSVLCTTSYLIAHCGHDNLVFLASSSFQWLILYVLMFQDILHSARADRCTFPTWIPPQPLDLPDCLPESATPFVEPPPHVRETHKSTRIALISVDTSPSSSTDTVTHTLRLSTSSVGNRFPKAWRRLTSATLRIFNWESTDKRGMVFQICSAQGRTWTALFQMIPPLLFIMSEDFMSYLIFVDCARDLSLEWLVLQNMTLWPLIDQCNTHNWLHKITQQTFSRSGLIDAWLININVLQEMDPCFIKFRHPKIKNVLNGKQKGWWTAPLLIKLLYLCGCTMFCLSVFILQISGNLLLQSIFGSCPKTLSLLNRSSLIRGEMWLV